MDAAPSSFQGFCLPLCRGLETLGQTMAASFTLVATTRQQQVRDSPAASFYDFANGWVASSTCHQRRGTHLSWFTTFQWSCGSTFRLSQTSAWQIEGYPGPFPDSSFACRDTRRTGGPFSYPFPRVTNFPKIYTVLNWFLWPVSRRELVKVTEERHYTRKVAWKIKRNVAREKLKLKLMLQQQ